MTKKLAITLLLELTVGCFVAEMRQCKERVPAICMNSTNIQISQEPDHYRLKLCIDNQCTSGTQRKWIMCSSICDACKSILPNSKCNDSKNDCERKVIMFLSDYCSRNIPSTHTPTAMLQPTCTSSVANQNTQKSPQSSVILKLAKMAREQTDKTNASALTTLGVFLCLLVIALAAISIGWIWTDWTLKKKLSQKDR